MGTHTQNPRGIEYDTRRILGKNEGKNRTFEQRLAEYRQKPDGRRTRLNKDIDEHLSLNSFAFYFRCFRLE